MRIPERLKIGAHDYKVIVGELDNKCGLHDVSKAAITIDATLPVSRQGSTLIHEVFHALNSELEHALLDSLAEQIYQVLQDNDLLKD